MTFAEALDILGVRLPINAKIAAKAFRKRAKETHPDAGGDPQDFMRVTKALEVVHLALADAMDGRGEVHWDRQTGDLSWRQIARQQMTIREVDGGTEVRVELTSEQTDYLLRAGDGGAFGAVISEGARAFMKANRRRPRPALPEPEETAPSHLEGKADDDKRP
jgi:hypothetical protein